MHGKSKFSKIKEPANISNILPRPVVSNGLIIEKLKGDLKYGRHLYFELSSPTNYFPSTLNLGSPRTLENAHPRANSS